jgi:outer membrane protein TolC
MQGKPRITVLAALLLSWSGARAQAPASPPMKEPPPVNAMPTPPAKPAPGAINLKPAMPEASDVPLPINLAAALRLADARPLTVAAAQASVWAAEAQLQHARVLWVPTLNIGFDYVRHDGFGPDFNRGLNTNERPLNQNINFLYAGGGLIQTVAATDAIFTPLAARQTLNSRRYDIQTAKNDAQYETANAYFNVHRYRGMYAGANDTVERARKLVLRVEALSKDLVPKVEIDRAKKLLADLEQHATSAREDWRIASADLTLVLRLDPRAVVVPLEHDHLQLTLIDPSRALDDLIPIGLTNRPELASQQALVQAVLVRIRQEKLRPLIPSVYVNGFQTPNELLQFGAQGIGAQKSMNWWSFRDDFSPQLLWQAESMGLGNAARVKEQRAEQSRAIIELFRVQDRVAADVTRSQARLQSAAARVLQAERSLHEAIITYDGNYEGLTQTKRFGDVLVQVYRPQEAVAALDNLRQAYDEYFTTVADYNRAQFQMFHALGYPAREISYLRPPGEAAPVDTSRPGYMPGVGTGPPPATR